MDFPSEGGCADAAGSANEHVYSFPAAAVTAKGAALARYKRLARARANTDMGIARISEVPYGEEGPEHAGR
jgi:hypothetical protein